MKRIYFGTNKPPVTIEITEEEAKEILGDIDRLDENEGAHSGAIRLASILKVYVEE